MNLEKPERMQQQIDEMKELAGVKATILQCSKEEVLPELMLRHGIPGKNLKDFYWAIRGALIQATRTGTEELEAVASQAVNRQLERTGREVPAFAREFLELLKEKIAAH